MIDNIVLNKIAIIERCLECINEEYQNDISRLDNFKTPLFLTYNGLAKPQLIWRCTW